jgi:hypothetical protein
MESGISMQLDSDFHYVGVCSLDHEAFLQCMDVGAARNVIQDTPSQQYDIHVEDEVEQVENVVAEARGGG